MKELSLLLCWNNLTIDKNKNKRLVRTSEPQQVVGMIEENDFSNNFSSTFTEFSTGTPLKEKKHAVSVEFEWGKWYEPIIISIVEKSKYSRFAAENRNYDFPKKFPLDNIRVFDWNFGGAIKAFGFQKQRVEYPDEQILRAFLSISNHGDFAAGFTLNDIRHIVLYKSTAFVWDLDGDQQVCSYG